MVNPAVLRFSLDFRLLLKRCLLIGMPSFVTCHCRTASKKVMLK